MNCNNCGATLEEGVKFCPVCGTPAPQPEPQPQPQPEAPQTPPQVTGYCPKCGQPYYGNPANCPSCGASLLMQSFSQQAQNFGHNFSQQAQNFGQNVQNGNLGQYFPNSGGGRVPSRSIALYIILSFVTCGIFLIYWLICIVNDLNTAADTPNDTNGVTVWLLSLVTCGIYGIYWMYKAGEKVSAIKRKYGEPDSGNTSIVYLVLQIVGLGLINYCLIQNELNKVAARG